MPREWYRIHYHKESKTETSGHAVNDQVLPCAWLHGLLLTLVAAPGACSWVKSVTLADQRRACWSLSAARRPPDDSECPPQSSTQTDTRNYNYYTTTTTTLRRRRRRRRRRRLRLLLLLLLLLLLQLFLDFYFSLY